MSRDVLIHEPEAMRLQDPGFGRINSWWLPKVAPALAVAYCAALVFQVPGWAAMRAIAVVAFVGLCAGTYGYVLNDVFDLEIDCKARKSNPVATLSPVQRFVFCALALGLGFAPALIVHASKRTLLILGVEYLVLTVYSVPPFRLKGRGVLGLLCDAAGAHVVANLYVVSVLADGIPPGAAREGSSAAVFVVLLCSWELCLGLLGILVHQVEDRENDKRSGLRTFATETIFPRIRVPMSLVYAGELLAFSALCFVLRQLAPLLCVAAALYVAMLSVKLWNQWCYYREFRTESTLLAWWQLSHPFYESYFPLAAALQCAWLHPQLSVFAALHLLVFIKVFRIQLLDFRGAYTRLLLGGRLEVAEDAPAQVHAVFYPRPARRIDIGTGIPALWKVRMVHDGLRVRAGQKYLIKLKMRADKPRDIMFGIWQDHAPWGSLGHCEAFCLSVGWQNIWRQFTAVENDPRGYFGLWLGGESGSVEVRHWTIQAVSSSGLPPPKGGLYE